MSTSVYWSNALSLIMILTELQVNERLVHTESSYLICPVVWLTTGAPLLILQPASSTPCGFSAFCSSIFHSRPVHSLILSSHCFLCLPLCLPPCRIVLASPDDHVMCLYHFSLRLFTEVRRSQHHKTKQHLIQNPAIYFISAKLLGPFLTSKPTLLSEN